MCHNSGVQSAQIDRFVEQGMPQKIVKTVKYTIKKRVEEHGQASSARVCSCASASRTSGESQSVEVNHLMMFSQRREEREEQQTCPFGRGMGLATENAENIMDANGTQQQQLPPGKSNEAYTDVLAVFTQWTRKLLTHVNGAVHDLQSSRVYTLLTRTTQPAHVMAICILSFILLTVWPEIVENTSAVKRASKTEESRTHHLAVIMYLGAFATHFGAQIWMTFVSGLSLYFALPRHIFGQCQQILFPKYFLLNSILSICTLVLFVKYFLGNWDYSSCVQLSGLALTAAIEVTVRLYLAPPMLLLMHEKYKIEEAVGSGQEVGGLLQGDLVMCPHYQRIHKRFRRIHMTVAMGNIVTLVCTCLHLHYLASKLSFA